MNTQRWARGLLLVCIASCSNTLYDLQQEIVSYGYIPYSTPLEFAGTGTLVSGSPSHLELLSGPQTCFPDSINGVSTYLRHMESTNLPTVTKEFSINGSVTATFLKVLSSGAPSINFTAQSAELQKISFSFSGSRVEYVDVVQLAMYYPNMSQACKEYLNLVGFVIQALRVDGMKFSFYETNNTAISLTLDKIQAYLDLSANIAWHIENQTTLIIDTPKYIGYQLGSLRQKDGGISLYRASKTFADTFIFKNIGIVNDLSNDSGSGENTPLPTPNSPLSGKW